MTDFLIRFLQRIFIAVVSLTVIWVIDTQIFDRLDERLPVFWALTITYALSAYVLLPRVVQVGTMILRKGHIPRVTRTAEGLQGDPVNIVIIGTEKDLKAAFATIGWQEADPLAIVSGWRMISAFLRNRSYPAAPFSSLYLFGRRQDHGFQQTIGQSPRKRHHVRFWAANIDPETNLTDVNYWMTDHPVDPSQTTIWVGACTRDNGIGLTRLTYKITHRVDRDVDEEREYILASLRSAGLLMEERYIEAGQIVRGKYRSDGRILVANLMTSRRDIIPATVPVSGTGAHAVQHARA